jgi:integrase
LDKVVDSGRGPSANRAYRHLKSFYRWCEEEDLAPPAAASQPRERPWFKGNAVDVSIKGLWDYASRAGGDEGKLLKLLLITGKRRNAVAGMTWEQIDDNWYWTPPKGSRTKRNNPIPLPKLAQRVLGRRPDGGGSVFDSFLAKRHVSRIAAEVRKHVLEPTYLTHGVRHVVMTKLTELKVAPHIARLVLDHASMTDAHSGYEHVDWTPDMCTASRRARSTIWLRPWA